MYYYKTFYSDGTWDILKSNTRLIPKKVCSSCIKIQLISWIIYYWLTLTKKIKYFNK